MKDKSQITEVEGSKKLEKLLQDQINHLTQDKFKNTAFALITYNFSDETTLPKLVSNINAPDLGPFLIAIGHQLRKQNKEE